jgi:hypothetical protein
MNVLLSTAYWPNIEYFFYIIQTEEISIEQFENYPKQSYRNRTQILSANGRLDLVIPVNKSKPKEFTRDIRLQKDKQWRKNHWGAITSAYRNSPFFEYFEEDISQLYKLDYEFLLQFNCAQLELLFKILKLEKEIKLTTSFEANPANVIDLRKIIHPKKAVSNERVMNVISKPYTQTFNNKFEFVPNLSILDLLFNKGLESGSYLSA